MFQLLMYQGLTNPGRVVAEAEGVEGLAKMYTLRDSMQDQSLKDYTMTECRYGVRAV